MEQNTPKCFFTGDEITDPYCYFKVLRPGIDTPLSLCFEIGVLVLTKNEEKELLKNVKKHQPLEITLREYEYLMFPLKQFKETVEKKHLKARSLAVLKSVNNIYYFYNKGNGKVVQGSSTVQIAASL